MKKTYEIAKKSQGVYILQRIKKDFKEDRGCLYVEGIFTGSLKTCREKKKEMIERNGTKLS